MTMAFIPSVITVNFNINFPSLDRAVNLGEKTLTFFKDQAKDQAAADQAAAALEAATKKQHDSNTGLGAIIEENK